MAKYCLQMAGGRLLQMSWKLPAQCLSVVLRRGADSIKHDSFNSLLPRLVCRDYSNQPLFRPQIRPSPYKKIVNPRLLAPKSFDYLNLSRSFIFNRKKKPLDPNKRRVPKLILVQNPFKWIMIKIDFGVLKAVWDPSFVEKEFKFGTKQAISRVTQVISAGQFADLNGLLTKPAKLSLMRELDRKWGSRQRKLLSLDRDDIQISTPRKVYFIKIADKKFCDVDMAFLALKWAPINNIDSLIFTEIFARFHRDYTPHAIPDWTIAYFKVTRFEVLRRQKTQ